METCGNCGRGIGELEFPCLYRDKIVCVECARRLGVEVEAPKKFVDYLLYPRMVFLLLLAFSFVLSLERPTGDHTMQWILLACWLVLLLARYILYAAYRQGK